MQKINFESIVEAIVARDPRYHQEAYGFLREALEFAQKRKLSKLKKNPRASTVQEHLTGPELLEGIREYALAHFGPMTLTVFEEWRVRRCEDFGEIVFNLIDFGLLSKTETDKREDFQSVYDFQEAFRKPFLPKAKTTPATPQPGINQAKN